ncbi:hypothetical protein O181_033834 [Austropuccinia psidii MF-1]|uniref:Uncharacterized protein n=1 Tax=Austropuccinia psidii MF-1 TaxID=1389203 RepID=A0A9Q3CZU3_9BASI|nr:hypothetical protein [Austropuccinia psidii MF-1]
MCTTHTKNPHLRPNNHTNRRKAFPYQSWSAQLPTAQVLVTRERFNGKIEELIINCGATHHMFNSRSLFSFFVKTPPVGVCTRDSTSSLFSGGLQTINLLSNNKIFFLKKCVLMLKLKCKFISLLRL